MRIKTVDISDEAAEVLRRGTWRREGLFILPPGQLDRKLYEAIDKALRALGGKWNKSARGHLFDRAAAADLEAALEAGSIVDQKKTLEQFFTPADLAGRMVGALNISAGTEVLEPSAGNGRLIWEAIERGANVTAIEIDPELVGQLQATVSGRLSDGRVDIIAGDFLSMPVLSITPDVVIMNPPFSANQDIRHVRHAFDCLRAGGKLAAIMSPHFTHADDRPSREFRQLIGYEAPGGRQDQRYFCGGTGEIEDCTVELLPAGTFKLEGTNVAAVLVLIEKTP